MFDQYISSGNVIVEWLKQTRLQLMQIEHGGEKESTSKTRYIHPLDPHVNVHGHAITGSSDSLQHSQKAPYLDVAMSSNVGNSAQLPTMHR
jgi:hypothetical protein